MLCEYDTNATSPKLADGRPVAATAKPLAYVFHG